MEDKCMLCGQTKRTSLTKINVSGRTLSVVKCPGCGLIYQSPQPSREEVLAFYTEDYFSGEGEVSYKKDYKFDRSVSLERLRIIEEIKGPGKVLDIGCNTGVFLGAARERGWDAYGIDVSEIPVKEAQKKNGLNITLGELKGAHYPSGFFDLITMFESIEHLFCPLEELKEVRRILKDDGLFIIQTANMDSLRIRLLRSKYYYLPVHLYYFSRETAAKMLHKADFKVYKVFGGSEFDLKTEFKLFKGTVALPRLLLRKLFNKLVIGGIALNTVMVIYAQKKL